MATKILFEDNENVPISMLLKKSYNGNNIYFSSGCDKLLSKAISIQDKEDIIVIYYDVAPNNNKTTKGYRDLCKTIKTKQLKNIIVVPIICIEYIIVKSLYKYNQLIIPEKYKDIEEYLIKKLDWDGYINNCNTNEYTRSSIEHFYKYVLTQIQPQRCKRNSHKYLKDGKTIDINYGSGKYYYIDCPCNRFCTLKSDSKLKEKSEIAYLQLPLVPIIGKEHKRYIEKLNIRFKEVQLQDIEKERQTFYNELCLNMKVNGIKIKF